MQVNFNNSPRLIRNFLDYILGVRGYSINTAKAYNYDLMQFFNFLKAYNKIELDINYFNELILLHVKKQDILAFQVYLNYNRDNNPYTRQRKITAIRCFYNWLLLNFPRNDNPTQSIPNIQKVIRLPKYLDIETAKKIQKVFNIKNSKFPLRNNTIISLFLSTGMRVSELVNLNIKDVNFKDSSICVLGKGNKERTVYLNSYCKKQLLLYLSSRFKEKGIIDINEPLFIGYHHERLGVDGIEYICKKAYKLLGLEDMRYCVHTLRHTVASSIYINVKQDVLLLKELLRTFKYFCYRSIRSFI